MQLVGSAFMVNRCSWQSGCDQLDPPSVDYPQVRRSRNGHCPAV